jgi:spermidine synthase
MRELGYQATLLGELTLRVRRERLLDDLEVYEVKLGDEYLMSSLFTESERQLATLGLAELDGELDVAIGGLGLGYTAAEVLENSKVERLLIIDLFQAVIDWHRDGLVPLSEVLTGDPRCELRQGDFFELVQTGLDVEDPHRLFDAILVDIDHSPSHSLAPGNQSLYTMEGLGSVRNQLKQGGKFALWSNDPVDAAFTAHLGHAFGSAQAHDIQFPNPYTGLRSVNSVYVARKST